MLSRTVVVEGLPIHFLVAGEGPPVVMVHGLVASGKGWDLNMPALAAVRTVYALDLANMGRSGRDATLDAGLVAQAGRVVAFMDALGLTRADLVGSSHGGAICLTVAARWPERVRRMVLFSPANPFCENPRRLMEFYLSGVGTAFSRTIPMLPEFAKKMAFERVYLDARKVTQPAFAGFLESLGAGSVAHALGIVKSWWPDMEVLRGDLAAAARVPVLLVWGDRDSVVSLESGRELAKVLGCELLVVERAGHLPFAEQAGVCNAATLEFLGKE